VCWCCDECADDLMPHGRVRPFLQKSTCLTSSTSGLYAVQICSRDVPHFEGTKLSSCAVWGHKPNERPSRRDRERERMRARERHSDTFVDTNMLLQIHPHGGDIGRKVVDRDTGALWKLSHRGRCEWRIVTTMRCRNSCRQTWPRCV